MANVTVENLQSKTIHCKDKRERLLDILLSNIDWMHACGGKGRCTTCKAIVVEGEANLSPLSESEERYRSLKQLNDDERLTCQTYISGDIRILAPEEYKLPHLTYSN